MKIVRMIAALIISVSVAVSGIPAQAASACPMAKMTKVVEAGQPVGGGHTGCHKPAESQTKPDGCCSDPACSAKCSALGGSISFDLPATGAALPDRDGRQIRLHPMVSALASHLRHTQERPPKSFA